MTSKHKYSFKQNAHTFAQKRIESTAELVTTAAATCAVHAVRDWQFRRKKKTTCIENRVAARLVILCERNAFHYYIDLTFAVVVVVVVAAFIKPYYFFLFLRRAIFPNELCSFHSFSWSWLSCLQNTHIINSTTAIPSNSISFRSFFSFLNSPITNHLFVVL